MEDKYGQYYEYGSIQQLWTVGLTKDTIGGLGWCLEYSVTNWMFYPSSYFTKLDAFEEYQQKAERSAIAVFKANNKPVMLDSMEQYHEFSKTGDKPITCPVFNVGAFDQGHEYFAAKPLTKHKIPCRNSKIENW